MADIIRNIKEQERNEFEEEHNQSLEKLKQELASQIKIELSQVGPQYFPLVDIDLQSLAARVSTKGSNVEIALVVPHMMQCKFFVNKFLSSFRRWSCYYCNQCNEDTKDKCGWYK